MVLWHLKNCCGMITKPVYCSALLSTYVFSHGSIFKQCHVISNPISVVMCVNDFTTISIIMVFMSRYDNYHDSKSK